MMIPSLQLKLFGSPQISYQGQPLNGFVSAKVRALLIYLAVTGRPHSRDHLAELLWADTPASTRTNLRKALSNLRQLIGNTLVEDAKESIALNGAQVWVDAVEFGRLIKDGADQEAVALYQTDFLTGFNLSLSYEFEAWALSEQSRLKSQMVEIVRSLATHHTSTSLSAGSTRNTFSQAILTVRRLLDLEPWHEENHRWLMELLAKDGQRSAALAHFEVCKRVLWDELAVEPSAETLAFVERIQRTSETVSKPRPKPTSTPKPEFPLIGREKELRVIQQAWQTCLQQGTHFVSIAGEAGIGKTRLTEEVRIWVEAQGYATVYARSYAAEGALAYSPVVDWLRGKAIRPTLAHLETVWLSEVARLLPELLTSYSRLTSPDPISDGLQRRHFFEALVRAVTVSEQPLLLVIDDLQWCDSKTLEWLRFLLRFSASYPLLVVGTFRIEEIEREHQLHEFLGSLRQTGQVTEFELRPLNSHDTSELARLVSNERMAASQVAELYQETSGHPLFVIESMRNRKSQSSSISPADALIQTANGSAKVQNVIQSRLTRLSMETRELVELAATIGRSFSLPLLKQASQRKESALLRQLDELWQRRIVVEKETGQFDFSHDRIRETVYANLRPLNRQRLHHEIAEALETLYAGNSTEWNAQIAMQYQLAGNATNALPYFVEAARTLFARAASDEALTLINQAIADTELFSSSETDLRHVLTLLDIQYDVVRNLYGVTEPRLREIAERVCQLSEKLNDSTRNYMAHEWLRSYHVIHAEYLQARKLAEANLELAHKIEDSSLISLAYRSRANICFYMGELVAAKAWYDRSNAIIDTFDPQIRLFNRVQPIHVVAYGMTAQCYYLSGYLEQAEQRAISALTIAEASNHAPAIVNALELSIEFHFITRQNDHLQSKIDRLFGLSQQYGLIPSIELSQLYRGWSLVLGHSYNQGIYLLRQSLAYLHKNLHGMNYVQRLAMLIESYLIARQPQEGITTINEALAFADRTCEQIWTPELYRLQGELLLLRDADQHSVEESYQKSLAVSRKQSSRLLELRTSVSLARLWQAQGKQTEAYQLLAPIYNWFTEGFDTPDLLAAQQLLAELQPAHCCAA